MRKIFLIFVVLLFFISPSFSAVCTWTVTNCSSSVSDVGSLPWAFSQITGEGHEIVFNIDPATVPPSTGESYPGTVESGSDLWYRIVIDNPLSLSGHEHDNFQLRGSTQTSNKWDTNTRGPEIEIVSNSSDQSPVFQFSSINGLSIEGVAIAKISDSFADVGIGLYSCEDFYIHDCYIGISASGESSLSGQFDSGIFAGECQRGVIESNVISKCIGEGIRIYDSSSLEVYSNKIGTNAGGTSALENRNGVVIAGANSFNNKVGWKDNKGNVISGNGYAGIYIAYNAHDNIVANNIIGLSYNQSAKIPNGGYGIYIDGAGANNIIGPSAETVVGEFANVIAGNGSGGGAGVGVYAKNTDNLKIVQNVIGMSFIGGPNPSCEASFGNEGEGIVLDDCRTCEVGGLQYPYEISFIGGNKRSGITLRGNNCSGNRISLCFIGIGLKYIGTFGETEFGIGNSCHGISLEGAGSDNIIGFPIFKEESEIVGCNIIGSNEGDGIYISKSSGNKVYFNFIGGWPGGEGLTAFPNEYGININGSDNNYIGTSETPSKTSGISVTNYICYNRNGGVQISGGTGNIVSKNLIGSNEGDGIVISEGSYNKILGNFVGISLTNQNFGNTGSGVVLTMNSSSNEVGGIGGGDGNVISYNNRGVDIWGGTFDNKVIGNYIGTSIEADGRAGNTLDGVLLGAGSCRTFVVSNVISGNGYFGVEISSSTSNEVYRNYIGTDASGTKPIPNAGVGILIIDNSWYNKIGSEEGGNIISGNSGDGILISYSLGGTAEGNVIVGNFIGVGASGEALPNSNCGVRLVGNEGDSSPHFYVMHNDLIKNTIANNNSSAIRALKNLTIYNRFSQNSIYNNGGGILLEGGANDGISSPEVIEVLVREGSATMEVTGKGARANAIIELFIADAKGQGKTYLGSIEADATGKFSGVIPISEIPPSGSSIVATQTDENNNTSMFSRMVKVNYYPYQFDLAVGTLESGEDYVGIGTIEVVPVTQVKTRVLATNEVAAFYLKAINVGQTSEAIRVMASSGEADPLFSVKYYYPKDSTNEVKEIGEPGGITTPFEVPPGFSVEVRVEISYSGAVLATKEVLVTCESVGNPSKYDVVKMVATFVPLLSLVPPSVVEVDHFKIFAPDVVYANQTFVATVSAYDASGNKVKDIQGTTYLTVDEGTITPESISSSLFVNGDATINMSLSKIGRRLVRVANGQATGEVYITVANATQEYVDSSIPGLKIELPPGAITSEISISVTKVSDPSSGNYPAGFSIAGDVYEIGPSGTQFMVPVLVTIPISGGPLKDPKVYYWDGSKWSNDGIVIVSQTSTSLTFSTTHFTPFAPFAAVASNLVRFAPNPFNPNSGSGRFWYWLDNDKDTSIYLIDLSGTVVWRQSFASGTNGGRAGENNIEYDGKTAWGDVLGSGVYLYKIVQDGKSIGGGKIAVIK